MKQYIKEIGKHSIIYTISNILTRAAGLILIPIYTRFLSTSDYGIVANVVAIVNVLSIFYSLGIGAAWSRFYFDYEDRSENQKIFLGNLIIFLLLIGFLSNVIIIVWGESLFKQLIPDLSFKPYILLAIWTSFFTVFFNLKQTFYRIRQQSLQFGIFSLSKFIGSSILIIITVAYYKYGALGKVFSEFAILGVFFILTMILLLKDIKLKFDWNKLSNALKYSIGVIPHTLSNVLINVFDRLFLTNIKGLSTAGIYTVGFQFGSIMQLIIYSINLSWSPFFMKMATKLNDDAKPIFAKLSTYYVFITCFIGLLLSLFSEEYIKIFTTKDYYYASVIVPIYVYTFVINGMYFMVATTFFYIKKAVKYLSMISIVSAIINLILNIVLIPDLGMVGAAWARFTSSLFLFITTYVVSQKIYYIHFEYLRLIKIIGITIGLSITFTISPFTYEQYFYLFLYKILILVGYFFLLYIIKFFKTNELKELRTIFKNYSRIR
jgi:O-antigen/teichoic acid export membrane protein